MRAPRSPRNVGLIAAQPEGYATETGCSDSLMGRPNIGQSGLKRSAVNS